MPACRTRSLRTRVSKRLEWLQLMAPTKVFHESPEQLTAGLRGPLCRVQCWKAFGFKMNTAIGVGERREELVGQVGVFMRGFYDIVYEREPEEGKRGCGLLLEGIIRVLGKQ